MSDYLEIFYNKNSKPYTSYPEKFVSHIFQKYKMKEGQSIRLPNPIHYSKRITIMMMRFQNKKKLK